MFFSAQNFQKFINLENHQSTWKTLKFQVFTNPDFREISKFPGESQPPFWGAQVVWGRYTYKNFTREMPLLQKNTLLKVRIISFTEFT